MNGRAVFVLGMHRSGTSAITRFVNLLGVPIAQGRQHADDANPRGYWESPPLTLRNERLLNAFGGAWLAPPQLPPGWEDDVRLEELRGAARRELASAHNTSEWVWKDPRNCLTLGFWLRIAQVDPVVVLVYRDPLEVADSLARRDRLATPFSLALWERYNRAALASAVGLPVFVVRYKRLVEAPARIAGDVAAFLRERGFDVREPPPTALEDFIDPALRRSSRAELHDGLSPAQSELAAALEGLEGLHPTLAPPAPAAETSWVEPLFAERRRILALEHEQRGFKRELELIRRRTLLGLELRVVEGSAGWHLLVPARRLAALRRRVVPPE